MLQHPITGDAGSRRRPRAMDAQRRAAWKAALEKRKAGRAVWEMPAGVHAALLRPGACSRAWARSPPTKRQTSWCATGCMGSTGR